MTAVIETRGLTKHFGTTVALDGLDLTVEEGTVHGFLGPNAVAEPHRRWGDRPAHPTAWPP